jgi:hypothetical protein
MIQSMSGQGNCFDRDFFMSLKTDWINGKRFKNQKIATEPV